MLSVLQLFHHACFIIQKLIMRPKLGHLRDSLVDLIGFVIVRVWSMDSWPIQDLSTLSSSLLVGVRFCCQFIKEVHTNMLCAWPTVLE
jgi:hypothetical protein